MNHWTFTMWAHALGKPLFVYLACITKVFHSYRKTLFCAARLQLHINWQVVEGRSHTS